jgi:pimeloyl-ACP methyl ester carboxylesterase
MIYEGSRERGIDHAIVAGCSMGGYLAFALLRVAPEFVHGLVLVNTKAASDTEVARAKRLAMAERVEREGAAFLADEWPEGALAPTTVADRPDVVARLRDMLAHATPQGVIAAQRAMADRPDSSPLLATISVPCTVVHGLDDPIIPASEAQAMAASINGATFVGVRAAGHVPSVEQPSLVSAALGEFLARMTQG